MNITTIKTTCAGIGIVVMLLPQFTYAQQNTSDRAQLLQTIQSLLIQVEALQALLAARLELAHVAASQSESHGGLFDDFEGDIIQVYRVQQGQSLPVGARISHQRYYNHLREVMPDKYADYFDQFVIFDNHPADITAFVAVKSDGRTADWVYGVSVDEVSEDPTSNLSVELMVHEFAHVFTLDQIITSPVRTTNCHDYFTDSVCYQNGTYLYEFIDEFWDDGLLDELALATKSSNPERAFARLYDRYDSEFVSSYAATDPAEDFAETFMWYVFEEEFEKGSVAAEKIEFMNRYQNIRSYKAEILSTI